MTPVPFHVKSSARCRFGTLCSAGSENLAAGKWFPFRRGGSRTAGRGDVNAARQLLFSSFSRRLLRIHVRGRKDSRWKIATVCISRYLAGYYTPPSFALFLYRRRSRRDASPRERRFARDGRIAMRDAKRLEASRYCRSRE